MYDAIPKEITSITDVEQTLLQPTLQVVADEMRRKEEYAETLETYQHKANETTPGCIVPIFLVAAIIPLVSVESGIRRIINEGRALDGFLIAGIVVSIIIVIGGIITVRVLGRHYKQQREEYTEKLPEIEQEAKEYARSTSVHIIPKDYRSSFALDNMAKYLEYGKADTWRECMELWDEQLFRWKVEENTAAAAEYSSAAARAAKAAAFFSATRK